VNSFVQREHVIWNARSFVIAGNYEEWDSSIGDSLYGQKRLLHQFGWHATPIEEISTVDDTVDVFRHCDIQNPFEIGEKVQPATAAFNSRSHRQIESEMGVGNQKNPDWRITPSVSGRYGGRAVL